LIRHNCDVYWSERGHCYDVFTHICKALDLARVVVKDHEDISVPVVKCRDVEAAISSTASASTPVASASNRAWTLSESESHIL